MKPIPITIALFCLCSLANAQQKSIEVRLDSNRIFTAVEQEPAPTGGIAKFYEYLETNLKYPDQAIKDDIQGTVFVTFTVEKDGSLSEINVLRGLSPEIDAEAIRLMRNCPKWIPGRQNGKKVRVQYQVPIKFTPPNK